jgi:hypothetical protein
MKKEKDKGEIMMRIGDYNKDKVDMYKIHCRK